MSMRPLVELLQSFAVATPSDRRDFLEALVRECHVRELSDLEAMLLPRLKVDFLQRLPMDVALHILTFLDDPRALARTAAVSRTWHRLSMNEYLWSLMCVRQKYHTPHRLRWLTHSLLGDVPSTSRATAMDVDEGPARRRRRHSLFLQRVTGSPAGGATVSLRDYFRLAYAVDRNWRRGGRLLRSYETIEMADADPDPNRRLALTCCAMDHEWTAVGMTSSAIFVFSTRTGKLVRVLRGHESGVWCLMLATGPSSGYDDHTSHRRRQDWCVPRQTSGLARVWRCSLPLAWPFVMPCTLRRSSASRRTLPVPARAAGTRAARA